MKKLGILFLVIISLSFLGSYCKADSIYSKEYESLNADKIKESLNDETQDLFREIGIDPKDYNWVNNINKRGVNSHIKDFLTSGLNTPLKAGTSIIALIILTAAITAFGTEGAANQTAIYACTVSSGAIITYSAFSTISAAANSIKGCSTFMLAFVPIFVAMVTLSGKVATATSSGSFLLAATEGVSVISSFFIMPFMGGFLSLSITSSISPLIPRSSVASAIKKIALWGFSLISTVFIGILGVQTAVNSAADTVATRTAKFIVGTAVPLTGTALAEAAATISSSMGLLKSSVGMYGIVAIFFILLPTIIEIIIWRIITLISAAVADNFSLFKISELLKAVDSMFSILLGLMLLIAGLFIISLTVVISAGNKL